MAVLAREILDSRGNPTVEVEVQTQSGRGRAAVPSDPIVAARCELIEREGMNAFYKYSVPTAAISLKQGFGRLIRSLHDRGLLALLDNRILKKSYGRVFVESLPAYRRTTDIAQVEKFFNL